MPFRCRLPVTIYFIQGNVKSYKKYTYYIYNGTKRFVVVCPCFKKSTHIHPHVCVCMLIQKEEEHHQCAGIGAGGNGDGSGLGDGEVLLWI